MDEQHEQGEQLELISIDEMVKRDVAIILGRYDLVTIEGKPDREALGDRLEATMRDALVEVPGDRAKQLRWANDLTDEMFPDVPGRAVWIEQEDPERAEKVWRKLRGEIVRVLATHPQGEMQRRFAANGGYVLCEQTSTRSGGDRGFYITRNPKCITEDLANPARQKALNASNTYAALTELAMERVPEHATKFDRDFKAGQKLITEGPRVRVAGALAAAKVAAGDGNGDVLDVDDAGDE